MNETSLKCFLCEGPQDEDSPYCSVRIFLPSKKSTPWIHSGNKFNSYTVYYHYHCFQDIAGADYITKIIANCSK